VAGADEGEITVKLSDAVAGKQTVQLRLGVLDKRPVSNYGVIPTFMDLKVTGLKLTTTDLGSATHWKAQRSGAFTIRHYPAQSGTGKFHLPLIVMTAAERGEYQKRHGKPATPERIAEQVKMALEFARAGKIAGVVTYCLDKHPGNPDFAAVAEVFRQFQARNKAGKPQ